MSRDRGWRGFESVPTGRSRRSSAILYAREGGAGGWLVSTVRTTASGVCGTMGVRIGLFMVSYRVVGPCTGQFDWSVAEHGRCRGGNGGGWGSPTTRRHEGNCMSTPCTPCTCTPSVEGQEQSRFAISDWPWPGGSSEMGPCGAQFLPFSLPLLFFFSSLFFSSRFFFYQRRRFIGPEPPENLSSL
jgi:hypothetical protein